jgi:RNA polymerase sigma factor (TIGR02999 family)
MPSHANSRADTVPPSPATDLPNAQALFSMLYQQLRRLARSRLSSGGRHTLLDTSSLVHEAFLRMQREGGAALQSKEHFLAYAATTMRSVIVDFVRRRSADRRGGDVSHVTLDTQASEELGAASGEEILDVHKALHALSAIDMRLVRVVEMRYFAGFTDVEIASALGITDRTVRRDWDRARMLLGTILGR